MAGSEVRARSSGSAWSCSSHSSSRCRCDRRARPARGRARGGDRVEDHLRSRRGGRLRRSAGALCSSLRRRARRRGPRPRTADPLRTGHARPARRLPRLPRGRLCRGPDSGRRAPDQGRRAGGVVRPRRRLPSRRGRSAGVDCSGGAPATSTSSTSPTTREARPARARLRSRASSASVAGVGSPTYHPDDWESFQFRVTPEGGIERASAHHGYGGGWYPDGPGRLLRLRRQPRGHGGAGEPTGDAARRHRPDPAGTDRGDAPGDASFAITPPWVRGSGSTPSTRERTEGRRVRSPGGAASTT